MKKKLFAEGLGSAFLAMTVVGSGIMAQTLSGGNDGIALLGNTVATAAILFGLISIFGPISGAHFNPAVSFVAYLRRELSLKAFVSYVLVQIISMILGVWLVHFMFDHTIFEVSQKLRDGSTQIVSEGIATLGLVLFILLGVQKAKPHIATIVALYITAAYWFTSSTSFANPAITLARALSDSFSGIAPTSVLGFLSGQLIGAVLAHLVFKYIFETKEST